MQSWRMATILSGVGTFRGFHKAARNKKVSYAEWDKELSKTPSKALLIIWFHVGIEKSFNRRVSKREKKAFWEERCREEKEMKEKKKIKEVCGWHLFCSVSYRKQVGWTAFVGQIVLYRAEMSWENAAFCICRYKDSTLLSPFFWLTRSVN